MKSGFINKRCNIQVCSWILIICLLWTSVPLYAYEGVEDAADNTQPTASLDTENLDLEGTSNSDEEDVIEIPEEEVWEGCTEIVSVSVTRYDRIHLEWTPVPEASGYYVYRKVGDAEAFVGDTVETQYTDIDDQFIHGTQYSYRVQPYQRDHEGHEKLGISSEHKAITYNLQAPVLVGAKVLSYTSIRVSWESMKGAEAYAVYRKTKGASWKRIATVDKDSSEYKDTAAKTGVSYYYTVRAIRYINDKEILGLYDTAGINAKTSLNPVTMKSTKSVANNQIQVSWNPVKGANGYYVYCKKVGTNWKRIAIVKGANASKYTHKGITGRKYEYKVRAYRTVDGSAILSPKNESTINGMAIPKTPVVKAAVVKGKTMQITWEKVSGVHGYRIYRKDESSKWKAIKTVSGGGTVSYVDKTAKYGVKYTYSVCAYIKNSEGTTYGNYDTKGVSGTIKPASPTLVSMTPVSKTKMKIAWKKVEGAQGYYIYQKQSNGKWKYVKNIKSGGTTEWTASSLTYNKKYTYTVRAYWEDAKGTKILGAYSTKGITAKLYFKAKYVNGYKLYYDASGKLIKDVDQIIGKQSSYVIKINKQCNVVTIYAKDGNNGYIIPVKACITSSGEGTPLGTFYTPARYRWHTLIGPVYGQWNTRIWRGILFHTVYYYENGDNRTLSVSRYNILGQTDSMGCCRLTCEDAKWIYDRCELNTKVIIYKSSNPGPFGKPKAAQLEDWHTWDPTDPNTKYLCEKNECH